MRVTEGNLQSASTSSEPIPPEAPMTAAETSLPKEWAKGVQLLVSSCDNIVCRT